MRYHYKPETVLGHVFGFTYSCNHPVYDRCTVFKIKEKGIAVIQQRFNPETKTTYWDAIDEYLYNDLFMHPNFKRYFDKRAGFCLKGLYPTVTVRQMMWALRMKPLKRERWETCFDRREV